MRHPVKLKVMALGFGFLLLFSATSYARNMMVNGSWLTKNVSRVIVVDARPQKAYMEGHIPGAVNIPVGTLQTKANAILYPVKRLERTLGKDGLTRTSDVVVYGSGMENAYLEYWMFNYLGMHDAHVLNGGIENWEGSLSTTPKTLPLSTFKAIPDPGKYATTAYVLHHMHNKNVVLLDVRTPAEFAGEDIRSLRGGHIPGAINYSHVGNFEPGTTMMKTVSELAGRYRKLDKKKEYVVYCQTGTRAANTYCALKMLDFPHVRVYDASWIVWGSDVKLPAADETYFNFISLIKRFRKLEQKVNDLESLRHKAK